MAVMLISSLATGVYAGENVSSYMSDSLAKFETEKADQGWVMGFGPDKLWRVRPSFDFKTVVDSNINREPSGDRDEDVIFQFIPAIDIVREGTKVRLRSGYELKYDVYVKDSDENAFNHKWKNNVELTGERVSLSVKDDLGLQKTYASSEQSERRTVLSNNLRTELKLEVTDKTSISGIYNNYVFHYTDSVLKDNSYVRNEFGGRVYYHMTPKTDLYIQGSSIMVDYYNTGIYDSDAWAILGGAVGRVTDKLVLSAESGIKNRNYDDDNIGDYDNWVFQGIAKYSITPKLAMTLSGKRDVAESVYGDTGWYGVHKGELGLSYSITPKIQATAGYTAQRNRYSRDTSEGTVRRKRTDWLHKTTARLTWEPYQYATFSSGYTYQMRNSNFNEFKYVDHMIDVGMSLSI